MTDTTPPPPPAQPDDPAQPLPAVDNPIPSQPQDYPMRPGHYPPPDVPVPPGLPVPPGHYPPPDVPVPPGHDAPSSAPVPPGHYPSASGAMPAGYYGPQGYYAPPPRGYVPPVAPDGRPLASFGDRLLAQLVDGAIAGGIAFLLSLPVIIWWFRRFAEEMTTLNSSYEPADPLPPDVFGDLLRGYLVLFLVMFGIGVVLGYLYYVELSWKRGQTIGKRVMKVQIAPVDPAEQRSRMMFVKRWSVQNLVGALVPFFSWIDGLWQLWDKPLQQCLHDKAARTVVVKIG